MSVLYIMIKKISKKLNFTGYDLVVRRYIKERKTIYYEKPDDFYILYHCMYFPF